MQRNRHKTLPIRSRGFYLCGGFRDTTRSPPPQMSENDRDDTVRNNEVNFGPQKQHASPCRTLTRQMFLTSICRGGGAGGARLPQQKNGSHNADQFERIENLSRKSTPTDAYPH